MRGLVPIKRDSETFRTRMLAYYRELHGVERDFARLIPSELGFKLRYHPYEDYPYIHEFFERANVQALLRGVEILHVLVKRQSTRSAAQWRAIVQRVFEEEGLAYTIDETGQVHSRVDEPFEQARAHILRGLSGDRYGAVRREVEKAFDALASGDQETKAAVRAMHDALEGYVKLLPKGDKVTALGPPHVDSVVRPLIEAALAGDQTAREVANQYLTGLRSWISACQPYRHAQGVTAPNDPPSPLAMALVMTGASYLRWFVVTIEI